MIVYNHAVLSLYEPGTLTRLLVADLDEFLVTARPMTVHQVGVGVGGGWTG